MIFFEGNATGIFSMAVETKRNTKFLSTEIELGQEKKRKGK